MATSAYQSEGGYNRSRQPQTNWAAPEALHEVMRSGEAVDFWNRYEEDFQRCRNMGLNAFRMSVEWSRIQPVYVNYRGNPPAFDLGALEHYADMLCACRSAGMEPILTLHHFVHPAWLGMDAWLKPSTPGYFRVYVRETAYNLNTRLIAAGQEPVRYYVTINEPNTLLLNTYIAHLFPSRSIGGINRYMKAAAHMLSAHVKAYDAIHSLHDEQGWDAPRVTANMFCTDLYWSDKVMLDLLAVKERGIPPAGIDTYIHDKANEFEDALTNARLPLKRKLPNRIGEFIRRVLFRRGHSLFNLRPFEAVLHDLEQSTRTRFLDYIGLDYYDPFTAHLFRMPHFRDLEFRSKSLPSRLMNSITSKWWDWHILPEGLRFFCGYYSEDFGGRDVLIAENGMALRRKKNNRHLQRRDRVTRSEFLRAHVPEVTRMAADGIPVIGYLYWSLFDNYEWGTYTPRFGLFSIDYMNDAKRNVEDHLGDRPSETYARLIREARQH